MQYSFQGKATTEWLKGHYPALLDTLEAVGLSKDNVVKTWVNGVPAAHWKNDEYLKGFFALQIHSGKQGKVLFDNIRIKELK